MSAIDRFRADMEAVGLTPPPEIEADGRLHRCSANGRRSDAAGWYVLHLDGVAAGAFGNWRDGSSHCWSAKDERCMTANERRVLARWSRIIKRQRGTELRQRRAEAAATALTRWAAAQAVDVSPYLTSKGVGCHGLRVDAEGMLLVPMRDAGGGLHSLQTIAVDGAKRFLAGGRVRGCYHAIGRLNGRLIICEGYATGATLHESTGDAVAVAFCANNLLPVAEVLRSKFPCLTLVLAADDDWRTDGNPGLAAATEAAKAVGGLLAVPNFTGLPRGDKDSDFNDLHRLASMVEVA